MGHHVHDKQLLHCDNYTKQFSGEDISILTQNVLLPTIDLVWTPQPMS